MGVPSPLWIWTNDIIAIKAKLGLSATEADKAMNKLALEIFEKGYDTRFQTAQAIPVFLNELLVRLFYAVRRLFRYSYVSCSFFRQHIRRPQTPEILVGFRERFCSLAILMDTGANSDR